METLQMDAVQKIEAQFARAHDKSDVLGHSVEQSACRCLRAWHAVWKQVCLNLFQYLLSANALELELILQLSLHSITPHITAFSAYALYLTARPTSGSP